MKEGKKKVLVITGPTAVGKTSLAIKIAEKYNLSIISCDSRQFYKEMSIGTAKPSKEELAKAPHEFVNTLSINEDFSAGDFEKEGLKKIREIHEKTDVCLMVGGSGLYIKAICEGFDEFPEVPDGLVDDLKKKFETQGIEILQEELQEKDPVYYANVDIQNSHRLIRALSIIQHSGKSFTSYLKRKKSKRPFDCHIIVIDRDREELYDRINLRVDEMFEKGLLDEVKALLPYRGYNALQTVGYKELFEYFDGKFTLQEAKVLIKRNSRRYAKRQLTWFRGMEGAAWYDASEEEDCMMFVRALMDS